MAEPKTKEGNNINESGLTYIRKYGNTQKQKGNIQKQTQKCSILEPKKGTG